MLRDEFEFIPAGTTIEQRVNSFKEYIKLITEATEFGIKFKSKNLIYILYLKDKLSKYWGFTIMIGNKTVINWGNNK